MLLLSADEDEEEGLLEIDPALIEAFSPVMLVEVDLTVSAHLNVKRYFEIKKKSSAKE